MTNLLEQNKETSDNGINGGSGRFAEGNHGGPGRPKGSPNKITALLKDDIAEAYQQRGGVAWLKGLKDRDFVRLLEKTMPKEISADMKTTVNGGRDLSKLTDEQLMAIAHASRVKPVAGI